MLILPYKYKTTSLQFSVWFFNMVPPKETKEIKAQAPTLSILLSGVDFCSIFNRQYQTPSSWKVRTFTSLNSAANAPKADSTASRVAVHSAGSGKRACTAPSYIPASSLWVIAHPCVVRIRHDVLDRHDHVFSIVLFVSDYQHFEHRRIFRLSRALRLSHLLCLF